MREPNFGWSYPPGCSGPPEDVEDYPLIDNLYEILIDEHLSDPVIDKVLDLVRKTLDEYEQKRWKQDMKSLPDESIFNEEAADARWNDIYR